MIHLPMYQAAMAERLPVLRRTLEWLEAHPDRAIAYDMALDENHRGVNPSDPNAKCFCFVGRLSVEAGIELHSDGNGSFNLNPIREWVGPLPTTVGTLMSCNDSTEDTQERLTHIREYLDLLEKMCRK